MTHCNLTIKAKATIRTVVADVSKKLWETKSGAVAAIWDALADAGYTLCFTGDEFYGDSGRRNLTIQHQDADCDNCVVFSWYRMPSGRYEVTTYIS